MDQQWTFTLEDLTRYIKTHIVPMKIRIPPLRPLIWVGASKKDYMCFPDGVRERLGYALYLAQAGESAPGEKALSRGILKGLGIRELVADGQGDTYRVVYTVKLRAAIYVLHAFQKKSTSGIGTPRHEIEVVRSRFAAAVRIDEASSPL
jgi:phage-related protein